MGAKTAFLEPFCTLKRSLCQDRLGTNVGKVEGNMRFVQRAVQIDLHGLLEGASRHLHRGRRRLLRCVREGGGVHGLGVVRKTAVFLLLFSLVCPNSVLKTQPSGRFRVRRGIAENASGVHACHLKSEVHRPGNAGNCTSGCKHVGCLFNADTKPVRKRISFAPFYAIPYC